MNFYKRIISLFLIFSICISSMVTVASAVDESTVPPGFTPADFATAASYGAAIDESFGFLQNATGYLGTLREAMTSGSCDGCPVNPDGRHNFMPVEILSASWAAALSGSDAVLCRYCGITYNEFYSQMYNSYLDDLKSDLGTSTLINGGIRLYAEPKAASMTYQAGTIAEQVNANGGSVVNFMFNKCDAALLLSVNYLKAPFNCTYVSGYSYERSNPGRVTLSSETPFSGSASKGEYFKYTQNQTTTCEFWSDSSTVLNTWSTYFLSIWVDVYPLASLGSLTTQDITVNSRPTTIIGDYGIIGDDGTIIHVEGNVIVDESTNTVYNPVTNTTNNFTDYAFDYSDRSYTLTLEDGTLLRVVYGDENITIEEGDTVYNIYYLIPNIPDGDDSGSGDVSGSEDWSWWRKAWQEFTDKLFGILGNGSTVNPDNAPSVPDDEESGDKGYTIIDLFVVLKDGTWAFITGIVGTAFDGFTSFVDAVASAGGFFTFFDEESQEGILFIPLEDGETIWD